MTARPWRICPLLVREMHRAAAIGDEARELDLLVILCGLVDL